jgi:hypothetical protein
MTSPTPSVNLFVSEADDHWDPFNDVYAEPSQQQTQTDELQLCQLRDWDSGKIYEESYMRYSLEYKITVNNRAIMPKDAEQGIVLALAAYWERILKQKLEDSVRKTNRSLKAAFTSVIASVTQRKEDPFVKRFDDISIDWAEIESQLFAWGSFYKAGKKLKVSLAFDYIDTSNTTSRSGGSASTTRQMLGIGNLQVDAEQHSSGQTSVWRKVYQIFHCRGHPCNKGPYCWCDPIGKKHHKLNSDTMQSLVDYALAGNTLERHEDVPQSMRQQLYDEEAMSLERHKKKTAVSTASLPNLPITITVLQSPSPQTTAALREAIGNPASCTLRRLSMPGFLDDHVEEYCGWQKSRVKRVKTKSGYDKACNVILDNGMDLELIRQDPNPKFLTDNGVEKGVADHVAVWAPISRTYRWCVSLRHVLKSPVISGRACDKCTATSISRNSTTPYPIRAPVVLN